MDGAAVASSYELSELLANFRKMLVALRFGKNGWTRVASKVMANNLAALDLVLPTGNSRAVGVVLNNMSLLAGNKNVRIAYPMLDAAELYAAAVEQARR